MPSKSFRYQDSSISNNPYSANKTHSHFIPKRENIEQKYNGLPLKKHIPNKKALSNILAFDKLKNLNTDDYILLFLIFMLIKDNDNPDWPLIGSLAYILFGFDD